MSHKFLAVSEAMEYNAFMRTSPPIRITASKKKQLESLAADRQGGARLAVRAKIILALAGGVSCKEVGAQLRVSQPTVRLWRDRFLLNGVDGLRDRPRSGRPPSITTTQTLAIVEATRNYKPPGEKRWSVRRMAKAMDVSKSAVHRVWCRHGITPDVASAAPTDGLYVCPPVSTDRRHEIQRAELWRGGRVFPFELYSRTLKMGPAGHIVYYWMNSSDLRRGEGVNFNSCIGYWWTALEDDRLSQEQEDGVIETGVLAESYRSLSKTRGMQKVFLDALISRSAALPRGYSLPPGEYKRLREMALRRDIHGIRRGLESVLRGGEAMPDDKRKQATEQAEAWLASGVEAFKRNGSKGLRAWADEWLLPRMSRLRKGGARGGRKPGVRLLLNAWTYIAKTGFYRTVANAWQMLLGQLESDGLDVRSSRFMRLWHMQNPNESGEDVFWGQVLSLHPLSGRVMLMYRDRKTGHVVSNAGYRAAIGRWLLRAHPDEFDAADHDCDEYWEVVAVIMAAAREYAYLHGASTASRRKRKDPRAGDETSLPEEDLLNAYAYEHGFTCPDCGALLSCAPGTVTAVSDGLVKATFTCKRCPHRADVEIDLTIEPDDLVAE